MGKKILLSIVLLLLFSTCSDVGLMETIEDAESLSDGNLSNNIFAHSLIELAGSVYLGSKNLWVKTDSTKDWSIMKIPSVDTDDSPVVSVATDGTDLFVATSNNVYRLSTAFPRAWSAIRPGDYTFYALHGADGAMLLSTGSDGVLYYDKRLNTWSNVTDANGNVENISDFAFLAGAGTSGIYYMAVGTSLKEYDLDSTPTSPTATPSEHFYTEVTQTSEKNITALAALNDNGEAKLGVLAAGDFFVYDPLAGGPLIVKGSNSSTNISLVQVGNTVVFGRVQAGYQIFKLPVSTGQWSSSPSTDGFTDNDSLALLSTGDSLMGLSLGQLLYFNHPTDDSKDRLYTATYGSRGLFSAKLKAGLWSWGQE